MTEHAIQFQKDAVELINIPNFLSETVITERNKIDEINEIRMEDVTFDYFPNDETSEPALQMDGVLTFERGKHYGIVGQNRSGKSTICKLLCKLYHISSGSLTVNGIDYADVSRVSLREHISYISQNPFLFTGTIRDNIKIGNPDATEEEIIAAAKAAGVFTHGFDDDIHGLKTSMGMRRSHSMNDMARASSRQTELQQRIQFKTTVDLPKKKSKPSATVATDNTNKTWRGMLKRAAAWAWEAETSGNRRNRKKSKKLKMRARNICGNGTSGFGNEEQMMQAIWIPKCGKGGRISLAGLRRVSAWRERLCGQVRV
eukprot:TRINITY_DN4834_c0_g1_i1.p1 TRINITY_DN4834_c0_g1~~TRINITY_DN4834_c0_g1_i1.p1  ORF type:complete len:315 (-),score=57.95 TRINITY_DN4834_c0_g1_i1:684-1628(-)